MLNKNKMRIMELEKQLELTKKELENGYTKLILELERSTKVSLEHIDQKVALDLARVENSEAIKSLRELVLAKLQEFGAISKELRETYIKQKEFIALAAKEAVEKVFKGEIKAMVASAVREVVSDKARELLFDDSNNSVLGVSEDLTRDVVEMLKTRIPNIMTASKTEDDGTLNEEEIEERRSKVLALERHYSFPKLLAIIKAGLMPMLVGPAGTGKSTSVEQAAYELGLDFYTSNRVQMAHELTGYKDASGRYQPTQFYQAYKNGGVFFLDEIDGSSPEALVTINTAMAQGYMNFPTGKVYMNENFRLVAAGNTYGTGADAQYVGRNELDAATLDRFVVVRWNYDNELESRIIGDKDLLKFGWAVRDAINKLKLPIIISTRGLINVYNLCQIKTYTKMDALESVLFEGVDAQTLLTIIREIKISNNYTLALSRLADKVKDNENY